MNEFIVYLDLDGVLADFRKGISKVLNAPEMLNSKKWAFWEDAGKTFEDVDAICTANFWTNLDWTSDGHNILRIVTHYVKPENIYLLTTPMPNLQSAWGKAEWVNKHLPVYNKRLIITRAPKHLLAGPNRLLIDDNDDNVNGFQEHGGNAILINRPWNRLGAKSDYSNQVVNKQFQKILIRLEEISG